MAKYGSQLNLPTESPMEHSGSQSCSDFGSQRSQERSDHFLPSTFSPIKKRDFGQIESSDLTDSKSNENDQLHFLKVNSSQGKLDNFILNYQRSNGYCLAETKDENSVRRTSTIRKSFGSPLPSILSDSNRSHSNSNRENNINNILVTDKEQCSGSSDYQSLIKYETARIIMRTASTDKRKGKRKINYPEFPATPVKLFQRESRRKASTGSDVEGSPSFASDFMC